MIPISRPQLGREEEEAVIRVLRSGRLAQGPEVAALEEEFRSMCGAKHAIAVANGTAALQVALLASGIVAGDEVIVPAFTFAATANAVLGCGARPVFCDVLESDFCIDARSAASRAGSRTRAIMPVHMYGRVADMEPVRALAAPRDLVVVEDAAQAHGASGVGASTATYSFYATKNMMTGEGGMITTNDDDVAARARLLRNHGMEQRYVHTTFGMNLRLTELQAALGREQLKRLPQANAARAENAAFYSHRLAGIDGLILPEVVPGHAWHQYTVRVRGRRDAVLKYLHDHGVGAEVYYPTAVHRQAAFAEPVSLPVSELLATEVLSLPVFAGLTEDERATVADTVARAMMEA